MELIVTNIITQYSKRFNEYKGLIAQLCYETFC
jgi:hypothetical protein